MEEKYPSQLGSLLRCGMLIMDVTGFQLLSPLLLGSRMTHFAAQSTRFADLYSSGAVNLVSYPDCYLFTAPHQLVRTHASRLIGYLISYRCHTRVTLSRLQTVMLLAPSLPCSMQSYMPSTMPRKRQR